jgi:hypothetical protein
MAFDNVLKKAAEVKDKVAGLSLESSEKIIALIEEYKRAVQALQGLGFSVGKVRISVGVLPEIGTSIKASLHAIDQNRVRELLEANREEKLLAAILSALITVTMLRDTMDLSGLRDVIIDITLGLPPRISIDLQ